MLGKNYKTYQAVFISDLHLHPNEPRITTRFFQFIDWAAANTESVYILGDFFHAWAGDDGMDDWSKTIAERLLWLSKQQVVIYFMHGNRDFLVGKQFARAAGMTLISEPTSIQLGTQKILLVHGDRYCTKDRSHQWFRRLTRNRWFTPIFLTIPFYLRNKMVNKIRTHSQTNKRKHYDQMDVVVQPMLNHLNAHSINYLVHGHTHKPGLIKHQYNGVIYYQYVLSDWDDRPQLLCYHNTKGLLFVQFS